MLACTAMLSFLYIAGHVFIWETVVSQTKGIYDTM